MRSQHEIVSELLDLGPDDGLLVGWILEAKVAAPGDATTVISLSSDNMDIVTHVGLATMAKATAMKRAMG